MRGFTILRARDVLHLRIVIAIFLVVSGFVSYPGLVEATGVDLAFDFRPHESLRYRVLISETIYKGALRTTNLYREEMTIQAVSVSGNLTRQSISCQGSVMADGSRMQDLGQARYYVTMGRDGRVLSVEGLRPWDERVQESIWLFQVILPGRRVTPGETWTVNDEVFSIADGGLVLEKRKYTLRDIMTTPDGQQAVVDYTTSRTGRRNWASFTYMSQGTFHLQDGRIMRLQSSEVLNETGKAENLKVITMIQVDLVDTSAD